MESTEKKSPHPMDTPTVYEIPLSDAETWTQAWVDRGNFVKAFLIDAQELQDILDEHGTSYVRVYFGWDATQEPGREQRMIMCPVTVTGTDMVPGTEMPSNVFDFTQPCPPTCDTNSKLYKVKTPSTTTA